MNPTDITVHQKSRTFDIAFEDGSAFSLPFEYLRVYSPSAEVRGHGTGQEVLQVGKRDVGITSVAPVGNYAIQPQFTDGHNTGLYTWDYLYKLGAEQAQLWQQYLDRLHAAGFEGDTGRDPGAVLPGTDGHTHHRGCSH
ncbi:gamma-butyrobetaine hydroxylase-like domain-containing protein [Pseudoduganella sp. GCM10020061]|uniref:gamma-butyrobetaine hydroxylase-like domain-containing protein n=1 Tax=Pseudoduganella sp. GCM10020061 TaxID=3317345 RepID=UPI0036336BAD